MEKCGYKIERLLGEGAYSKVYLSTRIIPPNKDKLYAIKQLKTKFDDLLGTSLIEIDIMSKFRGLTINTINDIITPESCKSTDGMSLVMPLHQGDLRNYIKLLNEGEIKLDAKTLLQIALDLGVAVEKLHESGVLHLDIKPENCLYSGTKESPIGVLSDFGIAAYVRDANKGLKTHEKITPNYRAPEILDAEIADRYFRYNEKSDVWSLALVFFELFSSGKNIYTSYIKQDMLKSYETYFGKNLQATCYKYIKFPDDVQEDVIYLLNGMLNFDPVARWTASQVVGFLSGKDLLLRPLIELDVDIPVLLPRKGLLLRELIEEGREYILYYYSGAEEEPPVYVRPLRVMSKYLPTKWGNSYVEELFLCLDIYYRSIAFIKTKSEEPEAKLLESVESYVLAALAMAAILFYRTDPYETHTGLLLRLISESRTDVLRLTRYFGGILYRKFIFHKCITMKQLLYSWTIIQSTNIYLTYDIEKFPTETSLEAARDPIPVDYLSHQYLTEVLYLDE